MQALVDKLPQVHGRRAAGPVGARCARVLAAAEDEAERLKDEFTSTEHLFLAIASEAGRVAGRRRC